MENQLENIGSKAARFSLGTLISRFSGMAREIATAAFLGASSEVAAFMIAYRFSMMLRRLLGEGGLLFGFVPEYENLKQLDSQKARQFFADLSFSLGTILLATIMVVELVLFSLHHVGFTGETAPLMMLMMPSLFFIIIAALWGAQLQCSGHFFKVGASPALINFIWIISLIFFHKTAKPTLYLSVAITFAFFIQMLFLTKKPWKEIKGLRPKLFSPSVRKLFMTLSFTLIGVGAMQVNSFVDMLFARLSSLEGPAYLAYAIRIQQLPLALISIAVASALLPALVRSDPGQRKLLLHDAVDKVLFFVTPCFLALIVLAPAIINLLYNRGAFDLFAFVQTTKALIAYSFALLPTALILVLNQYFYAKQDYTKPVIAAVVAVVTNLVCNTLFVCFFKMGPESVAWATAIASIVQLTLTRMWVGQPICQRGVVKKLLSSSLLALSLTALVDFWLYRESVIPFLLSIGSFSLPNHLIEKVCHFLLLAITLGAVHLVCHLRKTRSLLSVFKR